MKESINKTNTIQRILDKLMETEDCLITEEHLDVIEKVLLEEL